MRVSDLQDLAKIVGVSSAGLQPELRARLGAVIQEIRDTGTAVISVGKGRIPWVFTKQELALVDSRFRGLVIPFGVTAFCTTKKGVLQDPSSSWRMTSRMHIFNLLPVLFMDTYPAMYASLVKLVYAVTLLRGRCITEGMRRRLGYKTCFNHVFPRDINKARLLMPESLSEFANATSTSTQKSHLHHFVHYPDSVDTFGNLEAYWMCGDERRNKVIKDMAKQRKHCEASIARVYTEFEGRGQYPRPPPPVELDTCCVHAHTSKPYDDSVPELSAVLSAIFMSKYHRAQRDMRSWTQHRRCLIAGISFTANTSIRGVLNATRKMRRCSSVITMVSRGRSIYGWIGRLLSFDNIHVAHITWLPVPDYPMGFPVLCRLQLDHPKPDVPCVISLTDIEPARCMILHTDTCMYITRMEGINTL